MEYSTEELELNGVRFEGIRLKEHESVLFILGSVHLTEDNGVARLGYNYEVIDGNPVDVKSFERSIGDFIMFCLETKKETFAYYGGK